MVVSRNDGVDQIFEAWAESEEGMELSFLEINTLVGQRVWVVGDVFTFYLNFRSENGSDFLRVFVS